MEENRNMSAEVSVADAGEVLGTHASNHSFADLAETARDETNCGKPVEPQPVPFRKYGQLLLSELPRVLPIAYLCMIGIGMIFNYCKYSHFGINIYQYASVFDFLISPFEDYIILLFTFCSLAFCALVIFFDYWTEKKFPKLYSKMSFNLTQKKGYKIFRVGLYIFIVVAYVWIGAIGYGFYAYKKVKEQADIEVVYYNNDTAKGKQIGKTNDVIFLLESEGITKAIPLGTSVREIRYNYESPRVP